MARSEASLEEMYANLVIEGEEEEDDMVVPNTEVVEQKPTYMLVGKFLTEKNINFQAMQNLMASLWRPREGMEFYDMGDRKFSFIFFHKLDVQKVLEGGPWSFEQAMLVLNQVSVEEDPNMVQLQDIEMWVQIHDMPRGFISESILKNIGGTLGKYIKSEPGTFEGGWKPYIRIRVAINSAKPIKRRMKIKREGSNGSWINFKYEKLGTFCFVCGIIGHSEKDCAIVYANPDRQIDKPYGTWLRAQTRGAKLNAGARWIRNAGRGEGVWSTQKQQGASSTGYGEKEDARFMQVDGRIREIGGEAGEVLIKAREFRANQVRDNYDLQSKQLIEGVIDGDMDSTNERVVVESKRKRIEPEVIGGNNGMDILQITERQQKDEPKNLLLAGPGVQARQSL